MGATFVIYMHDSLENEKKMDRAKQNGMGPPDIKGSV